MRTLPEQLRTMADDIEPNAMPPVDPRVQYRTGRRRVRRDRSVVAASLLAVALVLAVLTWPAARPGAALPADGESLSTLALPDRVVRPYVERELTDAPGRASAVIVDRDTVHVVFPDGSVQRARPGGRVPNDRALASLSPDGRYLLTAVAGEEEVDLRDLTTSDGTGYRSVSSRAGVGPPDRAPAWTADSTWVFVPTGSSDLDGTVGHVLSAPDGPTLRVPRDVVGVVPAAVGDVQVAGWADTSTLLAVVPSATAERGRIVRWRIGDPAWRRTTVEVPATSLASGVAWSLSLSPDGTRLLSTVYGSGGVRVVVARVADGGLEVDRALGNLHGARVAWIGWSDSMPIERGLLPTGALPPIAGIAGLRMAVDPRLPGRLQVATDAVDGPRHEMLWGDSTAWYAWWWRELALGLTTVAALTMATIILVRRRRRVQRWSGPRTAST